MFYVQNNQEMMRQQDQSLYYVNISGKQRFLAQRIVFLSQMISTNWILNRKNPDMLLELRNCINELSSFHQILQNFVIFTIVGDKEPSTLNDVYFGSGGLMFKMERFLESANLMFYVRDFKDILQLNQSLMQQLDGENGLLMSLELATLSQRIYWQAFLHKQERNAEWLLYFALIICVLQVMLCLKIWHANRGNA